MRFLGLPPTARGPSRETRHRHLHFPYFLATEEGHHIVNLGTAPSSSSAKPDSSQISTIPGKRIVDLSYLTSHTSYLYLIPHGIAAIFRQSLPLKAQRCYTRAKQPTSPSRIVTIFHLLHALNNHVEPITRQARLPRPHQLIVGPGQGFAPPLLKLDAATPKLLGPTTRRPPLPTHPTSTLAERAGLPGAAEQPAAGTEGGQ